MAHFLEAIGSTSPVLLDLYKTVFPIFMKPYKRFKNYQSIWSTEYRKAWLASWDWAVRADLTRGLNLEYLRSDDGLSLAAWYDQHPYWEQDRMKLLSEYVSTHSMNKDSLEVTFAIPLIINIWYTLCSWASRPPKPNDLYWTGAAPSVFKKLLSTNEVLAMKESEDDYTWKRFLFTHSFEESRQRVPPYEYKFTVRARDVLFEREDQAKARIRETLNKQLDKHLSDHAANADKQPHLESRPEKTHDHYEWLVMYQVAKNTFTKIASLNKEDGETLGTARARITFGIKTAAELLVGPQFKEWLRPYSELPKPRK